MQYQNFNGLDVHKNENSKQFNLEKLKRDGYFVVKNAIKESQLKILRAKIDSIWQQQLDEWGSEFLKSIGDYGQVRCMMDYDEYFFDLVRLPEITEYVFEVLGSTAILHLQNGIVLHPNTAHNQAIFHRDFPRNFVASKILSLNCLFAIDPFNSSTGGTWVVPGSHLMDDMPSKEYLEARMVQLEADPGDVIIFDSLLWHKGGSNNTEHKRRAINQQYTRPFIKQQVDYPSLLKDRVDLESPLAQTLGMWSVPSKSLQEFRVRDRSKRTYRAGQG